MLLNGGSSVGVLGEEDGTNPSVVSGNGTGAIGGGNTTGGCKVDSTLSKTECL